jgi:hypothetical protein
MKKGRKVILFNPPFSCNYIGLYQIIGLIILPLFGAVITEENKHFSVEFDREDLRFLNQLNSK